MLTPIGPLVAGITSRGANPEATSWGGGDAPCGTVPGLYVRPDAAIDWIESVIGEQLTRLAANLDPKAPPEPEAKPGMETGR